MLKPKDHALLLPVHRNLGLPPEQGMEIEGARLTPFKDGLHNFGRQPPRKIGYPFFVIDTGSQIPVFNHAGQC